MLSEEACAVIDKEILPWVKEYDPNPGGSYDSSIAWLLEEVVRLRREIQRHEHALIRHATQLNREGI
jgi:hypothetical protein